MEAVTLKVQGMTCGAGPLSGYISVSLLVMVIKVVDV